MSERTEVLTEDEWERVFDQIRLKNDFLPTSFLELRQDFAPLFLTSCMQARKPYPKPPCFRQYWLEIFYDSTCLCVHTDVP